jgi:hypothetical protein
VLVNAVDQAGNPTTSNNFLDESNSAYDFQDSGNSINDGSSGSFAGGNGSVHHADSQQSSQWYGSRSSKASGNWSMGKSPTSKAGDESVVSTTEDDFDWTETGSGWSDSVATSPNFFMEHKDNGTSSASRHHKDTNGEDWSAKWTSGSAPDIQDNLTGDHIYTDSSNGSVTDEVIIHEVDPVTGKAHDEDITTPYSWSNNTSSHTSGFSAPIPLNPFQFNPGNPFGAMLFTDAVARHGATDVIFGNPQHLNDVFPPAAGFAWEPGTVSEGPSISGGNSFASLGLPSGLGLGGLPIASPLSPNYEKWFGDFVRRNLPPVQAALTAPAAPQEIQYGWADNEEFVHEISRALVVPGIYTWFGVGERGSGDYYEYFIDMNVKPLVRGLIAHSEQQADVQNKLMSGDPWGAALSYTGYYVSYLGNSMITKTLELSNPITGAERARRIFNGISHEIVGTYNDFVGAGPLTGSMAGGVAGTLMFGPFGTLPGTVAGGIAGYFDLRVDPSWVEIPEAVTDPFDLAGPGNRYLPTDKLQDLGRWLDASANHRAGQATPFLDTVVIFAASEVIVRLPPVQRMVTTPIGPGARGLTTAPVAGSAAPLEALVLPEEAVASAEGAAASAEASAASKAAQLAEVVEAEAVEAAAKPPVTPHEPVPPEALPSTGAPGEGTITPAEAAANDAAGSAKGINNKATKAAANTGNRVHYDSLNGAKGQELPSALQQKYPDTEFRFTRRGQAGADVEVVGGRHPSDYPGSTWQKGKNHADFKPDTTNGRSKFGREIRNGKLPKDTQFLPYDPTTGNPNF